ncbi:MAG: hypothetical protein IIU28_04985, partial [Lachnospiraceae bacterium]|nr:hypothetical protein [Lachnospiraceae bacterium]
MRKLESPGGEEKWPFPVEKRRCEKTRIPRRGREMAISGGNEKNKESKNPPAPAYSLCAPWDASRLWNSLVVLRKPPAK